MVKRGVVEGVEAAVVLLVVVVSDVVVIGDVKVGVVVEGVSVVVVKR